MSAQWRQGSCLEFLALYETAEERLATQRPGVEFSRVTWVLLVLAVALGLAALGWAFWYVFAGGRS